MFFRFAGETNACERFFVQVKENKRGNKFYVSVFPVDKE
jgi:hypothetical protein